MLRFLGQRFGFDVDTVRRIVRIRKLVSTIDDGDDWQYANFETPYPVPMDFVKHPDTAPSAHIWNDAWNDLRKTNPAGYEMLIKLVSPRLVA